MKSLWDDDEAKTYEHDPLQLRVYTSRLLGQAPDLVLHGGGNTSVKAQVTNLLGDTEDILYVKGSGWDLATIQAAGFAPVRLHTLKRLAQLDQLSDTQMVGAQRAAMADAGAPTPSVEAILHAIIPFAYVDHTHADAVVAITHLDNAEQRIHQIYDHRVLIVPYVMPGFALAKHVYDLTIHTDWSQLDGMILMHHGVFTFADTAKASYERMIAIVSAAESYLAQQGAVRTATGTPATAPDLHTLARIRRSVSIARGSAMPALLNDDPEAVGFSNLPDAVSVTACGPLTPDHVIRTKSAPVVIGNDPEDDIDRFVSRYRDYFNRHANGQQTCLDPAPRWAVWPGHGTIAFGTTIREASITSDIATHTTRAIQWVQALGRWQALSEKDGFDVEYWELEQAKLRKAVTEELQGKIALVTGAASGIGRACVEALRARHAAVVALDRQSNIVDMFAGPEVLGLACDVTDPVQVSGAVQAAVRQFGGLDILISNAGIFPTGQTIKQMNPTSWDQSLAVNLSGHQLLMRACIAYLELGIDPAIVVIASKNVAAPGPGVAAYSVAKAGLTQLARVAALEVAAAGIRVNVIHPHAVFDTGLWTDQTIASRAKSYGRTIEQYRKGNLLGVEVTSKDVASLACAMAGSLFAKTTGAQVPIDGGNDRVI